MLSCSDSKEATNTYPLNYNIPDTSSVITLDAIVVSGTRLPKTDVFEPKDAVNPPETTQNDAKSDVLDKKDTIQPQEDTISSDSSENSDAGPTKPQW